jgi:hypothetical protein
VGIIDEYNVKERKPTKEKEREKKERESKKAKI